MIEPPGLDYLAFLILLSIFDPSSLVALHYEMVDFPLASQTANGERVFEQQYDYFSVFSLCL